MQILIINFYQLGLVTNSDGKSRNMSWSRDSLETVFFLCLGLVGYCLGLGLVVPALQNQVLISSVFHHL